MFAFTGRNQFRARYIIWVCFYCGPLKLEDSSPSPTTNDTDNARKSLPEWCHFLRICVLLGGRNYALDKLAAFVCLYFYP